MQPNLLALEGANFQGWVLAEVLGKGADGVVYKAIDGPKTAAVKIFFPESIIKNGLSEARERLDLQLTLAGRKHHEHLVEVYSGGEDASLGTLFLIMELVTGKSLDKLAGHVPAEQIPRLISQLAAAAKYLEDNELAHRDIKPANIIINDSHDHLTLLDLGIVHQVGRLCDEERLSGDEFVATLRYSPPEFVWRSEDEDSSSSWRAVTFYQIAATAHDLINGFTLFKGHDTPRARLYDSVRDRTPTIAGTHVNPRLLQTLHACLLKDWRQRLQLVEWEDLIGLTDRTDLDLQEQRILVRQARNREIEEASHRPARNFVIPTREQEIWELNDAIGLEVRAYLLDSPIFPRSRIKDHRGEDGTYEIVVSFEKDRAKGFSDETKFSIGVSDSKTVQGATSLSFRYMTALDEVIEDASWVEMFNAETAFAVIKGALLNTVEQLVPSNGE